MWPFMLAVMDHPVLDDTRGVMLKKRCGNAVPTLNKKEDCTK